MNKTPKQVIVVRKDLNMRKGKIAAQAAHASMKVILDMMKNQGRWFNDDNEFQSHDLVLSLPEYGALPEWILGNFKKICVSVDTEKELLDVHQKAKDNGILCSLILDSGLTEFGGVPTYTCCAIGPEYDEKINEITGGLKLL